MSISEVEQINCDIFNSSSKSIKTLFEFKIIYCGVTNEYNCFLKYARAVYLTRV
jgi:hypothetical protein